MEGRRQIIQDSIVSKGGGPVTAELVVGFFFSVQSAKVPVEVAGSQKGAHVRDPA